MNDLDDLVAFFNQMGEAEEPILTYGTKFEVADIKADMQIIERKGINMSKWDKMQLQNLQNRLENIQDKCFHTWELVLLFSHARQYCSKCDKENKDYRHY